MREQNLNKTLAHKLNELQELPGEKPFNKKAAWEKLETRVNKNRSSKKQIWYWAAAVCIAFVCISPLLLSKKTQTTAPGLIKENAVITPAAPTEQHKEATFVYTQPAPAQVLKPALKLIAGTTKQKVLKQSKTADTFITVIPENTALLTVKDLSLPDTALRPQPFVVKQKRSVVHLNELEEEDRMVSENIAKIKSVKKDRRKNADKSEYATGTINFRIYLKINYEKNDGMDDACFRHHRHCFCPKKNKL